MAGYGYLIVRNPGPDTAVEYGGLAGYPDADFSSPEKAYAQAKKAAGPGDQVHLLVVYESAEVDGEPQLAAHDHPGDVDDDRDEEEDEESAAFAPAGVGWDDAEVARRVTRGTSTRPGQVRVLYNDGGTALVKYPGARVRGEWIASWVERFDLSCLASGRADHECKTTVWNSEADRDGPLTEARCRALVVRLGLDPELIRGRRPAGFRGERR